MLFDIRIKSILVNSNPIISLCSEDIVAHEVLSSLVLYLKHYQILSVDFRIYSKHYRSHGEPENVGPLFINHNMTLLL